MAGDLELEAMKTILEALEGQDSSTQIRILTWVANRLNLQGDLLTKGDEIADNKGDLDNDDGTKDGDETFADLYHKASPSTNADRALLAGYWFQIHQGQNNFGSYLVNKELQNLGHRIGNVTNAFNELSSKKPALAIQVRKSGSSQQARKKYKLTQAGIDFVKNKL